MSHVYSQETIHSDDFYQVYKLIVILAKKIINLSTQRFTFVGWFDLLGLLKIFFFHCKVGIKSLRHFSFFHFLHQRPFDSDIYLVMLTAILRVRVTMRQADMIAISSLLKGLFRWQSIYVIYNIFSVIIFQK